MQFSINHVLLAGVAVAMLSGRALAQEWKSGVEWAETAAGDSRSDRRCAAFGRNRAVRRKEPGCVGERR